MLLSHVGTVVLCEKLVTLGYDTVSLGEKFPTFQRTMVPSASGSSSPGLWLFIMSGATHPNDSESCPRTQIFISTTVQWSWKHWHRECPRMTRGSVGLQRCRVPTFFVGSLRPSFVLLTEGSIVTNLGVNLLIIIWGSWNKELQVGSQLSTCGVRGGGWENCLCHWLVWGLKISCYQLLCQHHQATWPLKMGLKGFSEMSVTNYRSTLRNIQEEQRSHLHHGKSLNYMSGNTSNYSSRFLNSTESNEWCSCLKVCYELH